MCKLKFREISLGGFMLNYNLFARKLFLPTSDLLYGCSVSKKLSFLEESQRWNLKDLEKYQNKKLKQLMRHAYNNVPYYHNLLRSLNLNGDDFKTKGDLSKLPILTKDEIRKSPEIFLAQNIKKTEMIAATTSGSSGSVFNLMIDKDVLSLTRAMLLRGWGFAGYQIGDKMATIAGSSLLPKKISFSKKMIFNFNRNLPLSSYNMNSIAVQNYIHSLAKFNPKYIRGYPSSISIVAKSLLENNISSICPVAIITTAESLSLKDRITIMNAFNCEVFDQCGCGDGGENLCECEAHSGYHIGMERSIHEFINENGDQVSSGEVGSVILTDLWNYSMPLIRYDAGDMAVYTDEKCSCGRGLPLAKSIIGRSTEQIVLPDGSNLPGLTFTDIFEKAGISESILDYQIVQEKVNKFCINLVVNDNYNAQIGNKISHFFEGHMGIPLDINFNFVDKISRTNANKRKPIISKVKL